MIGSKQMDIKNAVQINYESWYQMARVNFRIDDKAKEEAEKQAASIGLDLSEYTRMLYKLDLSEMVRKAVEMRKEKK